MDVHKNARSLRSSRELLHSRVDELGWKVGKASHAVGLSERRAFIWLGRARAGEALTDRSSRPHRSPNQLTPEQEQSIVELRRLRMTFREIAVRVRCSTWTISRVLKQAGLSRLSQLEGPPPPPLRYEYERPGGMLHLDIKKLGRIATPGKRVTGGRRLGKHHCAGWEYLHVAIDDHSRVGYCEVLADQASSSAAAFLSRAVAWFAERGVIIERALTDNGGCYLSRLFRQTCANLKIKHKRTRPYTPRTNGKAERFIQTLCREWAHRYTYSNSEHRTENLVRYLHFYNYHRAHSALTAQAPASRLQLNNVPKRDT